jgi:phage baseplate assembly protein gpV
MGLIFSNSMGSSAKVGVSSRFTGKNQPAAMTAVIENAGNLRTSPIPAFHQEGGQAGSWGAFEIQEQLLGLQPGGGFQVSVRVAD